VKKAILMLVTGLLISCGSDFDTQNDPQITTVPGLSENFGTDINLYKLDPLKISEASVILPTGSTTTLQEVQQSAIFSLFRTPYSGNFNEGNIDNALVITLKVLNIPNRTRVPYIISGINIEDIESMILNGASMPPALAGYFDLGSQGAVGFANLVLIFKSDQVTEGTETVSLRLGTGWTNVDALTVTANINDTSITPVVPELPIPTYALSKLPVTSVNEGLLNNPVVIMLSTTNLERGTVVPWTISGPSITVSDIESMLVNGTPQVPSLSGEFIVNSSGSTTMLLTFKADQLTEGSETLVLGLPTVPGTPTVSVTINDTSTTPPTSTDTINPIISITSISNFVVNSGVTVQGVAVDNAGIRSVTWINRIGEVVVNQGSATLTQFGNYATWTMNIPLQLGNNNIEILATDTNGRTGYDILVIAGSVAMVSGESTVEQDDNHTLATSDIYEEEVQKVAWLDTNEKIQHHIDNLKEFKQLGLNSNKVVDLVELSLPKPPAEIHPCNRGYLLYLPNGQIPNIEFKLENNWWLLASISNRYNTDPRTISFYWAKQITDILLGVYDTGIKIDNTELNLGTVDAKINLGWVTVPYNYAKFIGMGALPMSRNEICDV